MIAALGKFAGGIFTTKYIMIALIAVSVVTTGLYLYQRATVSSLEASISKQQTEIDNLEAEAATQAIAAQLAKQTNAILSATIEAERARIIIIDETLKEIENAPETDDGPVAPVLQRTLDRLFPN